MPAQHISFQVIDGEEATSHLGELCALYSEVYAEPPYGWRDDHAALFADRFEVQRREEGFTLVEARDGHELAGFGFGVTLRPSSPWWHNLTTTLPPEVTTERPRPYLRPGRTARPGAMETPAHRPGYARPAAERPA